MIYLKFKVFENIYDKYCQGVHSVVLKTKQKLTFLVSRHDKVAILEF